MIGRVLYALIFVLMAVLAWVLRNLPAWVDSVSYFHWIPGFNGCADETNSGAGKGILELCYGTMSVYRVTAAMAVSFFASWS